MYLVIPFFDASQFPRVTNITQQTDPINVVKL